MKAVWLTHAPREGILATVTPTLCGAAVVVLDVYGAGAFGAGSTYHTVPILAWTCLCNGNVSCPRGDFQAGDTFGIAPPQPAI